MSNNLISLQNKRISRLETQLEEEKKKRDTLIESTKSEGLEPMHLEIEKTIKGWNLTLPLKKGEKKPITINELESLKACLFLMEPFYTKAQFRNQAFELYDRNTTMLFQDYRNFTEYLKLSKEEKKEFKKKKRDPKSVRQSTEKKLKSGRMPRHGKVQKDVPKIDTRIFDRNY